MAPDKSDSNPNGSSMEPSELLPKVYAQLRALADAHLQRERPDHTLQPTALVHEAYVRLAKLDKIKYRDETHFAAAAAIAIRNVLVDHARSKKAAKRGGGWERLTLSGLEGVRGDSPIDLLALDEALTKLAAFDADVAKVVELRSFGGLTIAQTARSLELGVTTVKDRWEFARVWLRRELGAEGS